MMFNYAGWKSGCTCLWYLLSFVYFLL